MNRDDIVRMARNAADYWANHYDRKSKADMELLRKHVAEKFIEIAEAEREACAKVAAWILKMPENDVSAAIRARGKE